MSKIAVETSIRSIRMAQRLFQRLSAAPGGTSKLRESHRPSQNATNGLMKLTFHRVAGIRVARAEDPMISNAIPHRCRQEAGQRNRGRSFQVDLILDVGDDDLHCSIYSKKMKHITISRSDDRILCKTL